MANKLEAAYRLKNEIETNDDCELLADPECQQCGGTGGHVEGGDTVPYGSTWVQLPPEFVLCDCVFETVESIIEKQDNLAFVG